MKPHQVALGEGCQRWLQRRPRYRPPGEPFDPGRCEVALIDEGTAKPWVIEHHYSGSYPAARLRVGPFLKERRTAASSSAASCCWITSCWGPPTPKRGSARAFRSPRAVGRRHRRLL